MSESKDILQEVIKELIRSFEFKIDHTLKEDNATDTILKAIKDHSITNIVLSALGNCLIHKSIKSGMTKKEFLKKLSAGWDYHIE